MLILFLILFNYLTSIYFIFYIFNIKYKNTFKKYTII